MTGFTNTIQHIYIYLETWSYLFSTYDQTLWTLPYVPIANHAHVSNGTHKKMIKLTFLKFNKKHTKFIISLLFQLFFSQVFTPTVPSRFCAWRWCECGEFEAVYFELKTLLDVVYLKVMWFEDDVNAKRVLCIGKILGCGVLGEMLWWRYSAWRWCECGEVGQQNLRPCTLIEKS